MCRQKEFFWSAFGEANTDLAQAHNNDRAAQLPDVANLFDAIVMSLSSDRKSRAWNVVTGPKLQQHCCCKLHH